MGKATERNKKKYILRIVLFIIFGIIVIGVCLAIWQKDNIKSVVVATQYSKEEIADKISQSKEKSKEALEQYQVPITRDFTLEEEEQIRKGTLSVEDAVKLIMVPNETNDNTSANEGKSVSENASSGASGTENTQVDPVSKTVGEHISEMYELKAYYLSELGALSKELKKQYNALDESQKGASGVSVILKNNLSTVAGLEKNCDAKVEAVLSDLESDLKALNVDTSVVQTMRDAYENEKSLKKSYYLSLYN